MVVQVHQQLLGALKKVDRPGTYCTSGRVPAILPGLEVAGAGSVALPLEKRQAAALKKQARQAPYGKGTQTVVDTAVRRVWEIDADQVTLANPDWPSAVEQVVRAVQSGLGLEEQELAAQLYKLLLYEPGSFFLPHRDGEKLDRMVATLVIVLPSSHEGGQLVVRHDGREEIVDFGPESRFQTQFAAFYADCEHEIRPIKAGFRLALVYNLVLTKSTRRITAPTSGEHIAAVARVLRQSKDQQPSAQPPDAGRLPFKLAVLLDHKYSQVGLTYDVLKGVDRVKASVLFEAARQAGYDAYLALVTYWENGSAEPSGGGYSRYGYVSDGDGEHEMGEVFDKSLTAEHFTDAGGSPLPFGRLRVDDDEIVAEMPLSEGEPDQEEFEGYTGNAGMTLERWYHHAAVILWPSESRFDVLCQAGVTAAVGGLERMVQQWNGAKARDQAALKQPCLDFADRIIAHWPANEWASGRRRDDSNQTPLLVLLETLGDISLIAAWLRGVLAQDASVDPGQILGNICHKHGWPTFQHELRNLFETSSSETIERNARLLADWSLRKDKNADRKNVCSDLAQEIMSAVERWNPRPAKHDWRARKVNYCELLPPLAQSFLALEENDLLERLMKYVIDRPKEFDLTTVQLPVLFELQAWLMSNVKRANPPLQHWLTWVRRELESRAAHPPRKPADWRRDAAISCKCADCQELSRFLDDPLQETLQLPRVQQRRQHLHQTIDANQLDTTHVTQRRGRPFTLVCTKTNASYDRALKAHQVDLDHLQQLRPLLDWSENLAHRDRIGDNVS